MEMGIEWFFIILFVLFFGEFIFLGFILFLEFILRLFGKSFDDEPNKKTNK